MREMFFRLALGNEISWYALTHAITIRGSPGAKVAQENDSKARGGSQNLFPSFSFSFFPLKRVK